MALATLLILPWQALVSADGNLPTGPEKAKPAAEREAQPAKAKAPGVPSVPALPGAWTVQSLSIREDGGKNVDLPAPSDPNERRRSPRPYNALFTQKALTLRVGPEVVTEMSYTLDPSQTPCAIDTKSADGPMLGICVGKGNELQISLNDKAKGRPRDFQREHAGMVLVLRRFLGRPLFVMGADGSHPRRLLAMPEFTDTGSPEWSPNGRKIAFDAWRGVVGERWERAHVFVVNADGSGPKDLGEGAMPSWSPDSKQLTFCQYAPHGVWISNADGSGRKCIAADGWGSEWSPKRNEIAYTVYQCGSANICLYDVAKAEGRMLLERPYRQIWWGMSWSPAGKWLCFKGTLPNGHSEIAAVATAGEKKGFKVILPSSAVCESRSVQATIAWGSPGNQILVCMATKTDRIPQLYLLDFAGVKPPQLLPGQNAHARSALMVWPPEGMAWSPDGKQLVLCVYPSLKSTAK
jgi:Tol biopolymer transport system component